MSKREFLPWRSLLHARTLSPALGQRLGEFSLDLSFSASAEDALKASPPTQLPVSCLLLSYFLRTETTAPGERSVKRQEGHTT